MGAPSPVPSPRHGASLPIGFAHRGGNLGDRGGNTLRTFRSALAAGARGMESDVLLTADGVPVLVHPRLPGSRAPAVSTLARTALPASVPTLADLYEQCGVDFELALDMPEPRAADAVVELARAHGAEHRLWLTYWRVRTIAQWRRQWPEVQLVMPVLLLRRNPVTTMVALREAGVDAINVFHRRSTAGLVRLAHAHGLLLFAWGLRNERAVTRVLAHGVDGVFVDDVGVMTRQLSRAAPRTSAPLPI